MSKPVKNLIRNSYDNRFGGVDSAVVIDIRGVKSNDNNRLRNELADNGVRVTVVKNSLAKMAIAESAINELEGLLEGPSALVYGEDSVVGITRKLLDLVKEIENLDVKGALMEGQLFGPDEIEALSKYPTREEAQAQAVQIILAAGSNLVSSIKGPGGTVASLVKAIEDKLEKGETIAKA